MSGNAPLLAVVVPTFRAASVLEGALASLAAQTFRDFEVIVSDGASPDATLARAEAWSERMPALVVDSRPDAGVYDAINRGVARARAPWFLVLGADDRLHGPDTLEVAAHTLASAPAGEEWIHGDVRMMSANQTGTPAGARYAGRMSFERLLRTNLCQQCIFYRRGLFDALGGFDLRFPLYADWEFNLRAAVRCAPRWIDLVVADYAADGMSASHVDEAFLAHRPVWLRQILVEHRQDPRIRPAFRQLLAEARWARKRRDWQAWAALRWLHLRLVAGLPVPAGR